MSLTRAHVPVAGPVRHGAPGPAGLPSPRRRRTLLAVAAGAALGSAVYLGLADARCPAMVPVLMGVLALGVVPSGRTLCRRLAVNGLVALGSLPLLWMPALLRSVDHGALALALAYGALLGHVLGASDPGYAVRRLVPDLAVADLLLVPALAAAVAWGWRLLGVRTPPDALRALLPGYDHAGHFDIFSMLWSHGRYVGALGLAPDGTEWTYAHYPAGFHADAASLAQVTVGLRPPRGSALTTYAHLDAALVAVGVLVLVACLVSAVPHPRALPLVAPLAVALTGLLWLPGGQVLWHGFENFWWACVCAACSLLLAARTVLRGREQLGGLLAVIAATLGVALNWMPLLSVSWVGPVVVGWVWWRGRHGRRSRLAGVVAGALAVLVVARAALDLGTSVSVATLVSASGGILATPVGPVVTVLVLVVGTSLALGRRQWRTSDPSLARVRWLGLGLLPGWGLTAVALAAERDPSSDYYATKLALGVLLVTGCWLALLLALLLAHLLPPTGSRRVVVLRAVAVAALTLGATQLFGHLSWARAQFEATKGVAQDPRGGLLDYDAMARGILSAVDSVDPDRALVSEYVATGAGRWYVATLPNSWFHALTGSVTVRTADQASVLEVPVASADDAVAPVRGSLVRDGTLTVLVDPREAGELRSLLGPALAPRVQHW